MPILDLLRIDFSSSRVLAAISLGVIFLAVVGFLLPTATLWRVNSLYAMAFAAPMATGVIGMVTAGIWCDRRSPVGPLWAGVGLFLAGMLLVGFAPRMELVVLGRAVHGLGSGLLLVSLYVVIGRAYPEALQIGRAHV